MDITQKKVKIQACFAQRLEQAMVSLLGDNPEEFWERLSEAEQEVVWMKWWGLGAGGYSSPILLDILKEFQVSWGDYFDRDNTHFKIVDRLEKRFVRFPVCGHIHSRVARKNVEMVHQILFDGTILHAREIEPIHYYNSSDIGLGVILGAKSDSDRIFWFDDFIILVSHIPFGGDACQKCHTLKRVLEGDKIVVQHTEVFGKMIVKGDVRFSSIVSSFEMQECRLSERKTKFKIFKH